MLEGGATLRAARGPVAARGPLAGLGAQLLLLVVLSRTVGLGNAGWVVGISSAVVLATALARALLRDPAARLGPAGAVTLVRATLAVGVAALTADSFARDVPRATLVAMASVALVLDFVDGRVARRTETSSALGATLDGEVDAFLILALSVLVAPQVGAWVLAIGIARYVFLAAGWLFAWMRASLPRRDWRKVVTAVQGIALTIAAAEVLAPGATRVVLAAALALLAESFGRDVWWLWQHRSAAGPRERGAHGAVALTVLSSLVVWAALVAPNKPWLLTPAAFVRLPLEAIVVVALAIVLPDRLRRVVACVVGPVLGVLVLVKLLDIGFFVAFDRPFNPVDDWSFFSLGVETVRNTFGEVVANLTVAAAAAILVVALVLPTLAVLRVMGVAARHRRDSLRTAAALAAAWVVSWAVGAQLVSGASIASVSSARLAVDEVDAVRFNLEDRGRFAVALRNDRFRSTQADRLLTGLRGKDVVLLFVESYGKLAVDGYPFSPSVDAVLDTGTEQLAAAGFSARSGWLTSPTFGGASWWAHATLHSGSWIDSQGRYDELVDSNRLTLATAFRKAGWRTVADTPANERAWPEGTSFYRYAQIYDRRDVGYRGPTYAFASMPDQYVLLGLQRLELAKPHKPLFAEVDLVSSHTPWTRIPPFIPWERVGDGSIFNRLPVDRVGLTDTQQGYATSIRYTLRTVFSFVRHYGRKNLVLVVLGDHQPSRVVGGRPGHDVPISIVARDPAVLERIDDWGWVDGMRPDASAPVWPMSAFRNRFLEAFGF